jgi:predicted Zn-dependent peptidase
MASLDVLLGHPADQHLTVSHQLNAVTPREIQDLARDLFDPAKALVTLVTP